MMGTRLMVMMCVALVALASSLTGASQSWTGDSGANLNWSNGQNWVGDPADANVPGSNTGDVATFDVGMAAASVVYDSAVPLANGQRLIVNASVTITLVPGTTMVVTQLQLNNGATLSFAGNGTVRIGTFTNTAGSLNITSPDVDVVLTQELNLTQLGGLTNTGRLWFGAPGAVFTTTGTLNLGNVGVGNVTPVSVLTIAGDVTCNTFIVDEAWLPTINNNLSASGALEVRLGSSAVCQGEVSIGGSVTVDGTLDLRQNTSVNGASTVITANGILISAALREFRLLGGGSLTVDRNATVVISGDLVVGANGLNIQDSDSSGVGSGSPSVSVNGALRVNGTLTDTRLLPSHDWAVSMTIGGDIALADTAGYSLMLDESSLTFTGTQAHSITLTGTTQFNGALSFGALILDASLSANGLTAGTAITVGNLTLNNAADMVGSASVLTLSGRYRRNGTGSASAVGGTLRPGLNFHAFSPITFAGISLTNGEIAGLAGDVTVNGSITIDNATLRVAEGSDATGVTVSGNVSVTNGGTLRVGRTTLADLSVTMTVAGNLSANASTIALGGDGDPGTPGAGTSTALTISGDLLLEAGASLEINADTIPGNGMTTLSIGDDFTITGAGSHMILGEGSINLAGDADLDDSADPVRLHPQLVAGSDQPEIHLTGGAPQLVACHSTGTRFMVSSCATASALSFSGQMLLIGDLDLSGSQANPCLTGQAGSSLLVGEDARAVTSALRLGSGDGSLDELRVLDLSVGSTSQSTSLTIDRMSPSAARLTVGTLTIEGDRTDNDSVSNGNEANAASVTVSGMDLTVTTAFVIEEGAPMAGADQGAGASLTINDSIVQANADLQVGSVLSLGTSGISGARLTVNDSTLLFANNTGLRVRNFCHLAIDQSTLTSQAAATWVLECNSVTGSVTLTDSSVTSSLGAGVSISLGSQRFDTFSGLTVRNSQFSNYTQNGVTLRPDVQIEAFENVTFRNGVVGGTHLAFTGDASAPGGTRATLSGLDFDATTIAGGFANLVTDGNNIVSISDDTDQVLVTIATIPGGNFGSDGTTNLDATLAELDDNDGIESTTLGDLDDDVRWEELPGLTVTLGGVFASGTPLILQNTANQTVFLADLSADGAAISIDELTLNFSAAGITSGGPAVGVAASLNVFLDTGTVTDAYDPADTLLQQNDLSFLVAGSGTRVIDLSASPISVPDGTIRRLGVAMRFSAGTLGTYQVSLPQQGIDLSSGNALVIGLPRTGTVRLRKGALGFVAHDDNGDAASTRSVVQETQHPIAMAFNVTNQPLALATRVTEITLRVNASYSGSVTAAELSQALQRLVLFSSADDEFNTTYVNEPGNGFGQSGDDEFFSFLTGGSNDIVFTGNPGTATLRFTRLGGLNVPAAGQRTFFLIFDGSSNAAFATKMENAGLRFQFLLESIGTTGLSGNVLTDGGSADPLTLTANENPPAARIASPTLRLRAFVPLSGGGGGSSGCSLFATTPANRPALLWLALAGGVLLLLRRKGVASRAGSTRR